VPLRERGDDSNSHPRPPVADSEFVVRVDGKVKPVLKKEEALAEPLASPACGGRHEGFCK
jgi:hypothetical protein